MGVWDKCYCVWFCHVKTHFPCLGCEPVWWCCGENLSQHRSSIASEPSAGKIHRKRALSFAPLKSWHWQQWKKCHDAFVWWLEHFSSQASSFHSGFYYLPDVGFLDILLEHQVSWWKDSTPTAFQMTPGSLEFCLHVRGDRSWQGLETRRHCHPHSFSVGPKVREMVCLLKAYRSFPEYNLKMFLQPTCKWMRHMGSISLVTYDFTNKRFI